MEDSDRPGEVGSTDADFRVVPVSRDDLVALQVDAEHRGFSTRWSSVEALLAAVASYRHDQLRAYRCLVMHSTVDAEGAVATLDIAPERLQTLHALNLDDESRRAFARLSSLLPAVTKP